MASLTMTIDHDYNHLYESDSFHSFTGQRPNVRWNSHGHSQKP